MKTFRKLQQRALKNAPMNHFNYVVDTIKRVCGTAPSMDPADFVEADLYAEKYLGYNLRRKEASPFMVEVDETARRQRTLDSFLLRELRNRRINETVTFGYNPITGLHEGDTLGLHILEDARGIIARILGDKPNLDRIVKSCDFGNGASLTLRRQDSQRQRKFERGSSATSGLLKFSEYLVGLSPCWTDLHIPQKGTCTVSPDGKASFVPGSLKRVSGAVLGFVPKTAVIDRIILMEPELNGFFQKGIGREIRRLLQQWCSVVPDGIDLNTSGDLNKDLAFAGSEHGLFATVDAEQASDSITLALCEYLLPSQWNLMLLAARSPYAIINGKHHRLQMMSGMGNGFTFELESVIFYAIGLAACKYSELPFAEQTVSIHGDDLVVPADVFYHVMMAYDEAGIVINNEKSFHSGPFRESCGGHYFLGSDVTPFYLKTATGRVRGDWFWLANSLLIWLCNRTDSYHRSPKGKDLLQVLLHLRLYSTNSDKRDWWYKSSPLFGRRSGIYTVAPKLKGAAYRCRIIRDIPRKARFTDAQAYVAWLCSPQVSPSVHEVVFSKRSQTSEAYSFNEEVDERDRTVKTFHWPDPFNGVGSQSLCDFLRHHAGQR